MIIYFADRHMNVLGQASTSLPFGFTVFNDEKIEDTDTGVASFSCYISFEDNNRLNAEHMTEAGNYLLRKHADENEFYTIIETEIDPEAHEIYIYAEDAGLDLLNEVAEEYEASETYPIAWYIDKWAASSGFEIGINEIPNLKKKLKWTSESTVTERLDSIASQFDDAEISYSFDIENLIITNKYINIFRKRGTDIGEELRINRHLKNIIVKKSVANLATALKATGSAPEGEDEAITLKGYKYDDGDFYVDTDGILKSRKAVEKWTRYCWDKKKPGYEGHIEKTYSYDTDSQKILFENTLMQLKSICEMEVNYEADISVLPENIRIGDRVNLVDDSGQLYVSARLLQLKTSVSEGTQTATFGEYLIKDSGISDKVEMLASKFSELAASRSFYTWIAYADDSTGAGISLDPVGKAYIGISANRVNDIPDITDPSVYKWSKIQGDKGDLGISLVSITEHYLVSNLAQGITIQSEGWSTVIPAMSAEKKYLWNYETLIYSDSSEEDLEPKIIGAYGDPGVSSPAIVNMTEQYYLSESDTEPAGGEWVRIIPSWMPGRYLWTRWCIEWSEPNPEILTYSEPVAAVSFNEIHQAAHDTVIVAEEAKENAENAVSQLTQVNGEIAEANKQIDNLKEHLDILESEMVVDYVTKGELTEVNTALGTRIEQNASEIQSTARKVQEIDVDASNALLSAEEAQTAADQAVLKAQEAQSKYDTLKQQADITDEQLAAAKEAVEEAQNAAMEAGDAAAAAQSAADSLADRVTMAESNITQQADQISLTVQKVEKMKIGGRNLLKDSSTITLDGSNYSDKTDRDTGGVITFTEGSEGTYNAWRYPECTVPIYELTAEKGMSYVFSADIKMTGVTKATDIYFEFRKEDESIKDRAATDISLEKDGMWQRVSGTLTVNNANPADKCMIILYGNNAEPGATIEYRNFKLEAGDKATDWSPAPEDVNVDIEQIDEVLADFENRITNVTQTADDISFSVSGIEEKQAAMDKLKQQIEQITSVLIEDGKITFDFDTIKKQVDSAVEELERRNRYVAITEDETLGATITIGDSESGMVGRFTKESLDFLSGDVVVASYANDGLTTENITTNNQIKFGGNWAIRPGAGGNLNDVWIGG